jgi:poly-gamma-glutamate synthesis protein (capsule biosynthesis protein)
MNSEQITLVGVGDVAVRYQEVGRDKPETAFALVAPLLKADIAYCNSETLYGERTTPSWAGDHARRINHPRNIDAFTFAGFNVASMANNHTFDVGWEPVADAINRLNKAGIGTLGVGVNLDEARKPLVVERKGTRVAFLAYNLIGPMEYYAGPQNPGCAFVRVKDLYERIEHQPGTPAWVYTYADKGDLEALQQDIVKAKKMADIVVPCFHWGIHMVEHLLAMYQEEVGHAAIDAGADLILGHHPHLIKGIEVYKGKVIFYSLGNFVMDYGPSGHDYSRWPGIKHNQLVDMLYDNQGDPEYPLYFFPPKSRPTLIAKCIIRDKKIAKVSYYPCLINKQGQPEPLAHDHPKAKKFTDYVASISETQGRSARFSWEGDEVLVAAGDKPSTRLEPNLLRFYNPHPSCETWA